MTPAVPGMPCPVQCRQVPVQYDLCVGGLVSGAVVDYELVGGQHVAAYLGAELGRGSLSDELGDLGGLLLALLVREPAAQRLFGYRFVAGVAAGGVAGGSQTGRLVHDAYRGVGFVAVLAAGS